MPSVDLVYDADCPNVESARSQLRHAFSMTELDARWEEWEASDPDAPARVRGYGSPTILVDGKDVAGATPAGGACCRIYETSGEGIPRAPSPELIASALRRSVTIPF